MVENMYDFLLLFLYIYVDCFIVYLLEDVYVKCIFLKSCVVVVLLIYD